MFRILDCCLFVCVCVQYMLLVCVYVGSYFSGVTITSSCLFASLLFGAACMRGFAIFNFHQLFYNAE